MPSNPDSALGTTDAPVTKTAAHTSFPPSDNQPDADQSTCPECDGELVSDSDTGGVVCADCNIVLTDHAVDRGASHYSRHPSDNSQQAPPPLTETLHDRGLSTTIDWRNADSSGTALSPEKRRQFNRLRKRNRNQIISSKERRLRFALGEIDRMACSLGLSDTAEKTAATLFRQIHNDGYVDGRCIDTLTAATVYIACRTHNHHQQLADVATVSRTNYDSIASHYKSLINEYDIPVPLDVPKRHLPNVADQLDLSTNTHHIARHLLEALMETPHGSGPKPRALAGAAAYAASLITACRPGYNHLTQSTVAYAADCDPKTIQQNYPKLLITSAERLNINPQTIRDERPATLAKSLSPPPEYTPDQT